MPPLRGNEGGRIKLSNWKCGGCGVVYSFEEWMTLQRVPAVVDDPDPKKNYGYTMVCKHCGYVFHKDKPIWKGYGEIEHHITSLHWLVNKLTHGKLAAPHRVDIELSTVFLELAHNDWAWPGEEKREPKWYESMFFPHREGQRTLEMPKLPDDWKEQHAQMSLEERTKFLAPKWTGGKPDVDCWIQQRYHTEEQAIEGHNRWLRLFEAGRYLITYSLERLDSDPESKYSFRWRIDFDEKYRRILHGAKLSREMEGTVQEYTMEAQGVEQKGTVV